MTRAVTTRGHAVRPSFVLVGGWCLRREKLGTTSEGSWLAGGSWPGSTSYDFTKKVKMDGTLVFQGSYTVMNEHNLVNLQVGATGNPGPERVGQKYRNLKHWGWWNS